MSELLKYQYQARQKQVSAIIEDKEKAFIDEIQTQAESYRALDALLLTSPFALPRVANSMAGSEVNFFNLTTAALEVTAKRAFTHQVLSELFYVCDWERRGFKDIPVDQHELLPPPAFKTAFKNHEEILEKAAARGKEDGITGIFSTLEGTIPLMRYRLDIAERSFELLPSLDGGKIGYLDTKVPGVSLRLWYPKSERLPKTSLAIRDLG